ncbi:MAG: glycosyltransferase family 2 protein [Candidatus Omnitrophica bacterium]|nr:glycosyltransferase family 2 protein [Candidatus Omnitrophota bacterium]
MVSVIIPCFNAEKFIREALYSVLNQKIDDIEIIVVDDGSTDNSASIIKEEFPSVSLVKTENRGPSSARNLGTSLSKGEFIQYLDADDLLAPGKLKIQLKALQESGADIAYGNWQRLVKTTKGDYIKGEIIGKKLQNPEIDLFTDFWCPPAVYLFRRSIIDEADKWAEDVPECEDVRFILGCVFKGASFVYCDGIMAYMRIQPFGKSASTRNPMSFAQSCLKNAVWAEHQWEGRGGITKERRRALLRAYEYIARSSFGKDKETFAAAHKNLERLKPGYIPERPALLRVVSWLFGYRNAEAIALRYRNIKRKL